MSEYRYQTWGYHPDGSAQIFDLKEGESLPDGWYDHYPTAEDLASEQPKKRRGRPPKSQMSEEPDEEPGAELASELRDE